MSRALPSSRVLPKIEIEFLERIKRDSLGNPAALLAQELHQISQPQHLNL
jgi:hypothetical protein